jgi:hypothetical protein
VRRVLTDVILALLAGAGGEFEEEIVHIETCIGCSGRYVEALDLLSARSVERLTEAWVAPDRAPPPETVVGLLRSWRLGIAAAERTEDAALRARGLAITGLVHGQQSAATDAQRGAAAARHAHAAALRLAAADDPATIALSHADLTVLDLRDGHVDEALFHLEAALRDAPALLAQEQHARLLVLRGHAYTAGGDLRRALAGYREAWELARGCQDTLDEESAAAAAQAIVADLEELVRPMRKPEPAAGEERAPGRVIAFPTPEPLAATGTTGAAPAAGAGVPGGGAAVISLAEVLRYRLRRPGQARTTVERVLVQDQLEDLVVTWIEEPAVDASGHMTARVAIVPADLPVPAGKDFLVELLFVHGSATVARREVADRDRLAVGTFDGLLLEGHLEDLEGQLMGELRAWLAHWNVATMSLPRGDFLLRITWA